MGSRADFYVGRGSKAKWLGSTAWDGYPDGIEDSPEGALVLNAKAPGDFRTAVSDFLASRDDGTTPDMGWPWPWEDSNTTDYSYAFDKGKVYITCFGYGWKTYAEWQEHQKKYQEWRETYAALDEKGMDENAIIKEIGNKPGDLWEEDKKSCTFPNMKDVQNVTLGKRSGVIILGG